MKAIVIYNSKTGFTQRYGEWIAKELDCEAFFQKNAPKQLEHYDCIIFGGWIMGGKINGLNEIKSNPIMKGKKLIVFATGASLQSDTEVMESIKNGNLSKEEQEKIPFFYFQGGMNFEKMGFLSKTMIGFMKKSLLKKSNRTAEEEGMLKIFEKSSDISDISFIEPLVTYVKGI